MDTFRYVMAVVFILGLPPGICYWFVVHPFADFWRRRGVKVTFTVVIGLFLAAMAGLWQIRDLLAGEDLGTSYVLVAAGVPFLAAAGWIQRKRSKYLTFRILAGVPEVSSEDGGELFTEGIYGRIRHPRYVEFALGMIGWALVINYVGIYVLTLSSGPVLWLVVLIEERELQQRFGQACVDYMDRVPRFIPRR